MAIYAFDLGKGGLLVMAHDEKYTPKELKRMLDEAIEKAGGKRLDRDPYIKEVRVEAYLGLDYGFRKLSGGDAEVTAKG